MAQSIQDSTAIHIGCAECGLAPGKRFDMIPIDARVIVQQAGTHTAWEDQQADLQTLTMTVDDDRVALRRPRVVTVQFPAGEPSASGPYDISVELTYDGNTVTWPPEPRRVVFE